jgi:crossover junction endodeoxyribonuclease RuvC
MLIGIDPGCSGAIVLLPKTGGHPIEWERMPVVKVGSNTRVNGASLAAMLEHWCAENAHAYVENVGAMPGQGVTSMFSFGHATGTVMGVLGALGIAHTLVTPQTWKKRAGLIGKDKDAARSRAITLWPQWRELDKKGAGQAFADAALIALYGSQGA